MWIRKVEQRYLWAQNRLFDLRYAANLLTGEASTVVGSEGASGKVEGGKSKLSKTRDDGHAGTVSSAGEEPGEILDRAAAPPGKRRRPAAAAGCNRSARRLNPIGRVRVNTSTEPFMKRRLRCGAIRGRQRPAVHLPGL